MINLNRKNIFAKLGLGVLVFVFMQLPLLQFANAQDTAQPSAQTASATESIADYKTDITINKDATMQVVEDISYNFGDTEHHGILRDIPFKYSARGGTFKLRISNVSVTDDANVAIPFDQSTSGSNIELKIGDPNATVTGIHAYKISYTVNRAMNYFSDHDELYWNAIGTGWTVPITKASAVLHAPADVTQVACYSGAVNSTAQNCSITGGNSKTVAFVSTKPLNSGEGLTIVAGMPVGTVTKPTAWQNFWYTFVDNGILLLPILVLIIMLFVWWKYGRNAHGRGNVVAQYEPPAGFSPIYLGTLVDGKVDNRDITAEIVYLATSGYIKIERLETTQLLLFKNIDYKLIKVKEFDQSNTTATKSLFNILFLSASEITLSSLKGDRVFAMSLKLITKNVYTELTEQGFYKYNPVKVKGIFTGITTVTVFVFFVFGFQLFGVLASISILISAGIVILFGLIMSARTEKGSEMREYILGLKLFMNVTEKERLAFTDAPEKNPQQFEKLLPFAIALKVEKEWAKQFEGIYNQQPSWYSDSNGTVFNAVLLSNFVGDFSSSVQAAVSTVSSAATGGSGFSGGGVGGGGGGGGGGSW